MSGIMLVRESGPSLARTVTTILLAQGSGFDSSPDIALNTSHRGGDGSDHADVALNTEHRGGDGSDHEDVAANSAALTKLGGGGTSQVFKKDGPEDFNGSYEYLHKIGKKATNVNISGGITIDINNGSYQILTMTGNVTSITIDNTSTEDWGIIIEAINWGAFSIVLGSIKVPGGSISLTASGTDKLVLSGDGVTTSLSVGQADLQ